MRETGRNDPCPCGSGKKYKKCCLAAAEGQGASSPPESAGHNVNAKNAAPPSGRLLKAVALHQAGQLEEARAIYQSLLEDNPDDSDALHYLGLIEFQHGEYMNAVRLIEQAIKLDGNIPAFHFNLGNAYVQLREFDSAIDAYRKATQLDPGFLVAHLGLGGALSAQNRPDAAIESYRKVIALKPDHADAHNNLGVALQSQGKLDMAIVQYRKAVSIKPDFAEAHTNLGNALREDGRLDEAARHYRQALALKPELTDAHVGLAYLNLDSGKFEAARAALSKALEYRPEHPIAWAMLASQRKMTLADEDWLRTAIRLVSGGNPALPGKEAYNLWFAIGKYYDDTGQYDLAFAAFDQANKLRRQIEGGIDRAGFTCLIDNLVATFTAEFIGRQREGASLSRLPVLIVGMPRSGTSLIEQIIASHPDAFGAGELTFWGRQTGANEPAILSGSYGSALIARIAAEYEQHLQSLSATATRVVDKMPDNFLRIGFIATILPHAKIIHSLRNPVDTCLSIYFQNFVSGHSYGTDLEDLAFYYREYARLMHHWRSVLPADQFIEVSYEALVDDQAEWSRRIIEFIGLDWDERCLDFHETERAVGTASNWQVRQKIYRTSKARWRHYEKHLGPLLDLLDLDAAAAPNNTCNGSKICPSVKYENPPCDHEGN